MTTLDTWVRVEDELRSKVPSVKLGCLLSKVKVESKNEPLWTEIDRISKEVQSELKREDIAKIPAIQSSRKAYKACGKDPARYRLSAEALLRRVVNGSSLYQISNVVDIVNLVSLQSGFSIGGYDFDKIEEQVRFGIGASDELYEGIGRGELNIEFLPVFRDAKSAFGSPTSDSVRTCVSESTTTFLMIVIAFGGEPLEEVMERSAQLLKLYAGAEIVEEKVIG